MKEFAAVEWDRAQRTLDSARHLLDTDSDSSASWAYYAAFHALTALFGLRGQTFTKHSALRAALHRDLIQQGIIEKKLGKDYDYLMDLRETGDYGGVTQVSEEDAQRAIVKAQLVINAVAAACPDVMK
ncbi:MAG: HEPN domain-containing protein [Phycisphaerae bacterium]|nr:HEPN domain-containing protein [Phycisphaerae bacterium]